VSALGRRTALVVDDSAAMRRQLSLALERLGLEPLEAGNGAEAWRELAARGVDLLLTDINMPVMDGLKLVGLVRASVRHRRTPVVVVTTESAEADRARALALGVEGYLVKPVRAQQVLEVVQRLLEADLRA
jgi:two-component system, chemotaxis family, chemotaxis protein CheY